MYFVRHAQPDFSVRDDLTRPLTPQGLKDREKVTSLLSSRQIDVIYSSPYRRSADTVQHLADTLGLEIGRVPDFRERAIGAWVEDFMGFATRQWHDFAYKLPGGESLSEVQARNVSALLPLLEKHRGQTLVIGTHGTALGTVWNHFDPSFGLDAFIRIKDVMPYVVKMVFAVQTLQSTQECPLD